MTVPWTIFFPSAGLSCCFVDLHGTVGYANWFVAPMLPRPMLLFSRLSSPSPMPPSTPTLLDGTLRLLL